MTTKIAAVLAAAVLLAACGGSGASARNEQGVRDSYAKFASLVQAHKGDEACKQYMTAAARTLANSIGGCGELLNESAGDMRASDAKSWPITVKGDKATYRESDGTKGHAVFDGDHWRFDLSD